jgi:hypothetical protein
LELAGVGDDDFAEARECRDRLAMEMTPAQLAEARRMASEWRPKPEGPAV